jgi:hypothetical protein
MAAAPLALIDFSSSLNPKAKRLGADPESIVRKDMDQLVFSR